MAKTPIDIFKHLSQRGQSISSSPTTETPSQTRARGGSSGSDGGHASQDRSPSESRAQPQTADTSDSRSTQARSPSRQAPKVASQQVLSTLERMSLSAKPAPKQRKGFAGAIGSLISATQKLRAPTISFQEEIEERIAVYDQKKNNPLARKGGIAKTMIAGKLDFSGSAVEVLLGKKSPGPVDLSLITIEQLKDLKGKKIFNETLQRLSLTSRIYVYLETQQLETIKAGPRASGDSELQYRKKEVNQNRSAKREQRKLARRQRWLSNA